MNKPTFPLFAPEPPDHLEIFLDERYFDGIEDIDIDETYRYGWDAEGYRLEMRSDKYPRVWRVSASPQMAALRREIVRFANGAVSKTTFADSDPQESVLGLYIRAFRHRYGRSPF